MSLFDLLDNYKTTPSIEINKIKSILRRRRNISLIDTISFEEALDYLYKTSEFGSYELSIDDFIEKIALKNYDSKNENANILPYRRLCEFLLTLLDKENYYKHKDLFSVDEKQLWMLLFKGLSSCGYTVEYDENGHRATRKIDVEAEAVAASNPDYKECIFNYLISKELDEKESALTSLSIKLEAVQSEDKYVKKIREYVQLLRHKEEKKNEKKYSWFFNECYESNLDDLFKLFLSSIMHEKCLPILEAFRNKCEEE